ncbi:hypothetical protein GGR41_000499 [Paenalcaligenes hominis]|uniref:Uncharacterized protein n=1 Tax=Paenalcaligenes hominis TaxID=643674 RepID=A0ABX0WPK3_9BURK|nr:hypothetical protein [Paenalcaligenes hominis]NJB64278.1 hypothetical protein [Paenalcaligenes hominis]GGE68815.1 hypothetical protein GCM10007278_16200 [Paenalcaligenes hominis]
MNQSVLTKRSVFLLLGVVFIAANLRAPFTGLPPVLTQIQAGVGFNRYRSRYSYGFAVIDFCFGITIKRKSCATNGLGA